MENTEWVQQGMSEVSPPACNILLVLGSGSTCTDRELLTSFIKVTVFYLQKGHAAEEGACLRSPYSLVMYSSPYNHTPSIVSLEIFLIIHVLYY